MRHRLLSRPVRRASEASGSGFDFESPVVEFPVLPAGPASRPAEAPLPPGLVDVWGRRFPQPCGSRQHGINLFLLRSRGLHGTYQSAVDGSARLIFACAAATSLTASVAATAVEIFYRMMHRWVVSEQRHGFPYLRLSQASQRKAHLLLVVACLSLARKVRSRRQRISAAQVAALLRRLGISGSGVSAEFLAFERAAFATLDFSLNIATAQDVMEHHLAAVTPQVGATPEMHEQLRFVARFCCLYGGALVRSASGPEHSHFNSGLKLLCLFTVAPIVVASALLPDEALRLCRCLRVLVYELAHVSSLPPTLIIACARLFIGAMDSLGDPGEIRLRRPEQHDCDLDV